MEDKQNLFNDIKTELQKQVKKAYIEGAHQGAITTCAILYQTMRAAGLEEENLLFILLQDLAKQHGCEDLPAVVAKLQAKNNAQ